MNKQSLTHYVEQFHLVFLDFLGRKIDKNLYAVKGGCNLRFFFKSIRYSQDIDIDIHTMRKDTLQNLVDKLLKSTPFSLILRSKGIEVAVISAAKQTETTQRWKVSIQAMQSLIHTKIEFSRRGMIVDPVHFDAVDANIIQHYQLNPILANHYTLESAFKQKIAALALRSQTQARDVFDLFHLLNIGAKLTQDCPQDLLEAAIKNTALLTFEEFLGQVVAFLPVDYQHQYRDQSMWKQIVEIVTERLNLCA